MLSPECVEDSVVMVRPSEAVLVVRWGPDLHPGAEVRKHRSQLSSVQLSDVWSSFQNSLQMSRSVEGKVMGDFFSFLTFGFVLILPRQSSRQNFAVCKIKWRCMFYVSYLK